MSKPLTTTHTSGSRGRKVLRYIFLALGILFFVLGAAIIYMTLFQEQKATALYGDVKLYAAEVIRENGGTPPGEQTSDNGLPLIRLEGEGGQVELDWCTGAFVHMLGYYDKNELPPVWSAHNSCGGDVILNWQIGTHFMVADQEYEVVDFRTAPQRGSTTDDLAGIQGDLVLQSCTYDGYTMYFMGAKKVKSAEEIKAEKEAQKKLAEEEAKKKDEASSSGDEASSEEPAVPESSDVQSLTPGVSSE